MLHKLGEVMLRVSQKSLVGFVSNSICTVKCQPDSLLREKELVSNDN